MSLVTDIFEELWNAELNCKGWKVNFFGIPRFKSYKYNSVSSTLNRLSRNKLIIREVEGWSITSAGEKYYKNLRMDFRDFESSFKKNSPKDLLLMFDIPHEKSSYRNWLRNQLKVFGYVMIQKSVWLGPSPLPKEFTDYVKELKLRDNIRTFKIKTASKHSML